MARPLRIEYRGALSSDHARRRPRGNLSRRSQPRAVPEILGRACRRFRWTVRAYCLMSNHYHLLAETAEANLARGMRRLNVVHPMKEIAEASGDH